MIRMKFESAALLAWLDRVEKKPAQIRRATAKALNEVGNHAVERMVRELSDQSGVNANWIRDRIHVQTASPSSLEFRIDASRAMAEVSAQPTLQGRREFARRPDDYFHQNELVNVITSGDESVCPICEGMLDDNPMTIEDVRAKSRKINPWGNGLWHPNCRCAVVPFRQRRELPVEFRRGRDRFQETTMTARELTQAVSRETKVVLQAK